MVAGFLAVPLFKFAAAPILGSLGLESWGERLADLDALLPSFVVGFLVAVVVSKLDVEGRARMAGIDEELRESRQ